MRTSSAILFLLLSSSLAAGACRDEDRNALNRKTRESAERVGEARDDVVSARKGVEDERGEVARARAEGNDPSDVAAAQAEAARAGGALSEEQARLMKVRNEFLRLSQAQLEVLARRIDQMEARWGAAGQAQIALLRRDHADLAEIRRRLVDDPTVSVAEVQQLFAAQVNTVEENLAQLQR